VSPMMAISMFMKTTWVIKVERRNIIIVAR